MRWPMYEGKYTSPAALLLDDSVRHDEKVKTLEQWRNDERDLLRASEEGMQGDIWLCGRGD